MPEPSALEHELHALAGLLRKLETEYNMYFAGRTSRPPLESRAIVERAVRRFDRAHFETPVLRFQFTTLQSRYSSFADLWDRGVRAREEGRPGPFSRKPQDAGQEGAAGDHVVHVTAFSDPVQEIDKLRDLYDALMQARRETGRDIVPFHRFAQLVKQQVSTLRRRNPRDTVSFRVSTCDGKVSLKARAVRASSGKE